MRDLAALIESLKVPIIELRWWEESGIIDRDVVIAKLDIDYILASHQTPGGFIPVLLWYGQYYWSAAIEPEENWTLTLETGYWRVEVSGQPPEESLGNLRHIRKPWYPNMGAIQPCFYIGTPTKSGACSEILIHPILDPDAAGFLIGGFISGVDVPRQYFDKQLKGPEEG